MACFHTSTHHPYVAHPILSLSLTALSLLLLVLVLLSVPGPIKGLYWFSVENQGGQDGPLHAGVLGWCAVATSNCTYAALSENAYLSTLIDVGEALTVQITLPLACYWMIITFLLWIALSILVQFGYRIKDLDSISRHLRFAIVESCVLCASIFANVLCWLAFGLARNAYISVQSKGGHPKSGHAMETTAVAATISLLSLFSAIWALHLRVKQAQASWREQAVMVRRRSMALSAAGASQLAATLGGSVNGDRPASVGKRGSSNGGGVGIDEKTFTKWSESPDSYVAPGGGVAGYRGSMVKSYDHDPEAYGAAEEVLERELSKAEKNSNMMRRSSLSHNDSPYVAALPTQLQNQTRTQTPNHEDQ